MALGAPGPGQRPGRAGRADTGGQGRGGDVHERLPGARAGAAGCVSVPPGRWEQPIVGVGSIGNDSGLGTVAVGRLFAGCCLHAQPPYVYRPAAYASLLPAWVRRAHACRAVPSNAIRILTPPPFFTLLALYIPMQTRCRPCCSPQTRAATWTPRARPSFATACCARSW